MQPCFTVCATKAFSGCLASLSTPCLRTAREARLRSPPLCPPCGLCSIGGGLAVCSAQHCHLQVSRRSGLPSGSADAGRVARLHFTTLITAAAAAAASLALTDVALGRDVNWPPPFGGCFLRRVLIASCCPPVAAAGAVPPLRYRPPLPQIRQTHCRLQRP